jgi:hypothetical protein
MKVKDASKGADVRAISCVPSFQTVHVEHGLDGKQREELTLLRETMASYEPEVRNLLHKVSTTRTASLVRSQKPWFDEKAPEKQWGPSSWQFPLAEADVAATLDSEPTREAVADEKTDSISSTDASSTSSTPSASSSSSSLPSYFPFIVIGCDGLYDVMSNQEVCAFVNRKLHEIVFSAGKKALPTGKALSWRSVNAISKQVFTTFPCLRTCVSMYGVECVRMSIYPYTHTIYIYTTCT